MPIDTQGNRMTIVHMLLLLAHCMPSSIIPRVIQAVATLLKNEVDMGTIDRISTSITKKVDPLLNSAEQVVKEVQKLSWTPERLPPYSSACVKMQGMKSIR